jgi:hypothetical protein
LCPAIHRFHRGLINTLPAVCGRARADFEGPPLSPGIDEKAARGMYAVPGRAELA